MPDKLPHIPWKAIGDTLEPLLVAIPNVLERNTPPALLRVEGAPFVVRGLTYLAINTHRSIRLLSAPEPDDPRRRPEYSVSVPALSRTILEGLFNLTYVLDNPALRTPLYLRGGWRAIRDEHDRLISAYGTEPDWLPWLTQQAGFLKELESHIQITSAEVAKPTSVPKWPLPGKICTDAALPADKRSFLSYLYDWYYRDLSQAAHLTYPALSELAAFFLLPNHPDRDRGLQKLRSDWFVVSLILLLAHLSELELSFALGFNQKLAYCWTLLTTDFLSAREVYDRRYAQGLRT